MSETIPINRLRVESAHFGINPYLLTQSSDGRPHAVAVSIEWQGGQMNCRSTLKSSRPARMVAEHRWPAP